ncbi:alpha/beta fold hydrolase [uncultured Jatrophihabitans sp.]|uniref:alpha/beta fold hydrolase n=1 Tax=uncultured Jatrophihabitans sp. TaxID=1610747 RepID=UPI0035CA4AA6
MSTERFDVNGVTLSVTTEGPVDGPPVLLLHGFPDTAELWRHQVPALAGAGYRVLAPDLRGFGDSSRPVDVSAYRMRTLIGDVTGLLDALEIPSAAVIGHDWGAGLAWAMGMFAPGRVSSLVALSVGHPSARSHAGWEQSELSWYMLWFLLPDVAETVLPRDDWAFLRQWGWREPSDGVDEQRQVDALARPGALTAALNWYRANIDPKTFGMPPDDRLPHVTCPTLGVWSDLDPFLNEAQMTESSRFVDAPWRYERVIGVDHWLPVRAPEQVTGLLLDFLGGPR